MVRMTNQELAALVQRKTGFKVRDSYRLDGGAGSPASSTPAQSVPTGAPLVQAPGTQQQLAMRSLAPFVLPIPPSVNEAWYPLPSGAKILTEAHRLFRRIVQREVERAMRGQDPLGGKLELAMLVLTRDERRLDIDNRIKPLQDALQRDAKTLFSGAYFDDCQVWRLVVDRAVVDGPDERCEVTLREIGA